MKLGKNDSEVLRARSKLPCPRDWEYRGTNLTHGGWMHTFERMLNRTQIVVKGSGYYTDPNFESVAAPEGWEPPKELRNSGRGL